MIDGSSSEWLPAPPDDGAHSRRLEAEFARRLPLALDSVLRARTPEAAARSIVHGAEYLWPGCLAELDRAEPEALTEARLVEREPEQHVQAHGLVASLRGRTRLEQRPGGLAVHTALVADGLQLAELAIERPGSCAWFSRQERGHMRTYAELCSPALHATLEADQLRRLALTDALTGLPNLRALDHALDAVGRTTDRVSLLFLDADGLGEVNNRLDYEAGNTLIRALAQMLSACIGEGDFAARMGGDEFVTLLPGDDGERAAGLAAELERRFACWPLPAEIAAYSRGVSVGHVVRQPGEHPRQLLRRGAEKMRASKRRRKSDR